MRRGIGVPLFVWAGLAPTIVGCSSALKERELQRVARDWCMTIRASQVIPVYPLTADLQPGDVFLVTAPIKKQSATYRCRGFLPLDQAYARIPDLDFKNYYKSEFWDDSFAKVPHPRAELYAGAAPAPPADTPPSSKASAKVEAPPAAFPTYTFQVRSGTGIQVAFPVQGVPVGLGFMQTDTADGSISISGAFTYAAPPEELLRKVKEWAAEPGTRADLDAIARANSSPVYLRVVQRIYMTSAMNVSLTNASALGAQADVGDPKKVKLPGLDSEEAVANYKTLLDKLSEVASQGLPGGSLRFAAATRGSVVLNERFPTPLVIGYLGYDLRINFGGDLGPPVLTIDRLEERSSEVLPMSVLSEDQAQLLYRHDSLYRKIHENDLSPKMAARMISYMARGLPERDFGSTADKADQVAGRAPTQDDALNFLKEFWAQVNSYVSLDGGQGPRYRRVIVLHDAAVKEVK